MSSHAEREHDDQLLIENAIEIALWVGHTGYSPGSEALDEAGGISAWIQDRAVQFEKEHKDADWDDLRGYYDAIEDWITAYAVAQRMEN
ncbi:hypothetical protein [Paraburkholderia sp. BL10I2N1]|uniref:hypothetical protein n=1 Tax=Paraburkholderia sp. BL10I2N1 TaxID=1938796 RepID=UPI00105FBBA9|nr:hypothetical protein [Paraburkholderia sp. BL10I2N1]TDN70443.1 hypothetical protein B0G77_3917 [Paraburkholderia sp. BL10I2N1]